MGRRRVGSLQLTGGMTSADLLFGMGNNVRVDAPPFEVSEGLGGPNR